MLINFIRLLTYQVIATELLFWLSLPLKIDRKILTLTQELDSLV
jgi:hypothetical protein